MDEDTTSVLVVDDSETARAQLRRALEASDLPVRVMEASDGSEALPVAVAGEANMVISDIVMPRLDGVSLLRGIRQQWSREDLPVILLTSRDDIEQRTVSFESGANDYLTKPFSDIELVTRVQVQLRMRLLQDELNRANEAYQELERRDPLTGLSNRRRFLEQCSHELNLARTQGHALSVALFSLEAQESPRLADSSSDVLVTETAQNIASALRQTDTLARVGETKFGVILPHTDAAAAASTCARIRDTLHARQPQLFADAKHQLCDGSATFYAGNIDTLEGLLNAAEASLQQARQQHVAPRQQTREPMSESDASAS